jgi:hypothetical protein
MKKEVGKKLSLNRETLRALAESSLANAMGGGRTLPDSSSGPVETWSCGGQIGCTG